MLIHFRSVYAYNAMKFTFGGGGVEAWLKDE